MWRRMQGSMHKTVIKLQQLQNSKQIITITVAIDEAGVEFNHLGDLSSSPVRGSTKNIQKIALFGMTSHKRNLSLQL